MKNKTTFIIIIIFSLFTLSLVTNNSDIILISIFFLVYLGFSIAMLPLKEKIELSSVRNIAIYRKNDIATVIDVSVTIQNKGSKLCLFIEDKKLAGINLIKGSMSLQTALNKDEEVELKYSFETNRGGFDWEYIKIIISDPFECFESIVNIESKAEINILPQTERIRSFIIHPWKTLSSPGNIPIRMGGTGTDFWGVRDYHSGDPLKLLYWRLTARHPHKFYTREFVLEKTTEIAFILDSRYKMEISNGNKSIIESEIKAIASLSEMFIHQGYRVGLSVTGLQNLHVSPNYGKKQLFRILNCLAKTKINSEDTHNTLYNFPIKHYSSKTLIIVLSPMDPDDIYFYRRMRAFGFQVVLICPDTLDFLKSFFDFDNKKNDKITNLSFRANNLERKMNLSLISQLSVSVIDWKINEPLYPLVKNILGRPLRIKKM